MIDLPVAAAAKEFSVVPNVELTIRRNLLPR